MRKKTVVAILSLTTLSLTLSGCFLRFLPDIFDLSSEDISYDTDELGKTSLKYTYKDYMENNLYNIDSCPSIGSPKLLIIPIWFSNSSKYIRSAYKSVVREDISKAYLGSKEETGWNSVKTFYQEESNSMLNLQGFVTDWYECGHSDDYYYSETDGARNTLNLLTDAIDWYKSTYYVSDMSSFDYDKNGFLDGVIMIYAAPDYGALGDESAANLWAYCYWKQNSEADVSNPQPNAFFWASYDFMYGSNRGIGRYFSGDTTHCNIDTHTFIHEMGHVLGLQDYYDYSNQYVPAGGFSMQDYNVGGHDPYSVMAYGWANPYVIKNSCTVSIKPFQESKDIVLLSPNFTNSPFDEYLLLEYYTPTGLNKFDAENSYLQRYPQGSKTSGIRLWHVDGRLVSSNSGITSDIRSNDSVTHAMCNTYYKKGEDYTISPLGKDYADYNILQLIRNNTRDTYTPTSFFTDSSLFLKNDKFDMTAFSKQFKKGKNLNKGVSLGWSFKVDSITSEEAIITFTKI